MKRKRMLLIAMVSTVVLSGCQLQTKSSESSAISSTSSSQSSTNVTKSTNQTSTRTPKSTSQPSAKATDSAETVNATIVWSLPQALQSFKEACPVTIITKLKLDTSHGRYVYKLEGYNDTKEYEAQIDAENGQLTKEKEEQLDADDRNDLKKQADALETTDILSIEKASQIAEEAAKNGQAQEWELEKDNGITCWKVKVVADTTKTKVKMNAKTGQIIKLEQK